MYPNPAKDNITVVYEDDMNVNIETVEVSIFDMTGRLISKNKQTNTAYNSFSLDVSQLNEGVYIMEVADGTNVEVKRFVIAR